MDSVSKAVAIQAARNALSHHEQMLDAQKGCVPCKLCGGSAVITDAGVGTGYYIQCGKSTAFRPWKGCLIDERRLGGWAYNVMDWWNGLHSADAARFQEATRLAVVEECAAVADRRKALWAAQHNDGDCSMSLEEECEDIAAAIRALQPKVAGQ